MESNHATIREIVEQPKSIEAVLDEVERKGDNLAPLLTDSKGICLTGCGTSYFLSHSGSAKLNESTPSFAYPGSEVFMSPEQLPKLPIDLIIPVSRSGESTETVRATEKFAEVYPDATVLGVTCSEDSSIAERSDQALLSPEGSEESVVMTKSYSSMLVALESVARMADGHTSVADGLRSIPEHSRRVIENTETVAEKIGARTDFEKFVFLGGGPLYGVAAEAMLKFEEMTLSWTKAYRPLEFRHGPKSIADENMLVTIFLPQGASDAYSALIEDIRSYGAEVLSIGTESALSAVDSDHTVQIPSHDPLSVAIYAPVFQLIGYHRAIAIGLNPDSPKNLSQVVEL